MLARDLAALLVLWSATGIVLLGALHLLGGPFAAAAALIPMIVRFMIPSALAARLSTPCRRLYRVASGASVEALAHLSTVRTPHLYAQRGRAIDARAVFGLERGTIVVTDGVLERPAVEQAAVLAHEVAHLRYRHVELDAISGLTSVAAALAGMAILVGFDESVSRVSPLFASPIALSALSFLLLATALILPAWTRRLVERQADDFALVLTGDRFALVSLLRARERELRSREGRRRVAERIERLL